MFKNEDGDVLSGPRVKTLHSQCRGNWSGNMILLVQLKSSKAAERIKDSKCHN